MYSNRRTFRVWEISSVSVNQENCTDSGKIKQILTSSRYGRLCKFSSNFSLFFIIPPQVFHSTSSSILQFLFSSLSPYPNASYHLPQFCLLSSTYHQANYILLSLLCTATFVRSLYHNTSFFFLQIPFLNLLSAIELVSKPFCTTMLMYLYSVLQCLLSVSCWVHSKVLK